MGDEQGTLFPMSSQEAVQAEIGRIVRSLTDPDVDDRRQVVYGFRIMRTATGMTQARWEQLSAHGAPLPVLRQCQCAECTDEECDGDCEERCDDHDCEQCYGNHTVYDCCGYCPDCGEHVDNEGDDRCAHCNHCRDCDHYCN